MANITYGVKGMMEWQALIQAGKASVHVSFTGGGLTSYGVTPAEYSTNNPVMQRIIENSDYFKSGRIFVLRKDKEAEEHVVVQTAEPKSETTKAPEQQVVDVSDPSEAKAYLIDHFGVEAGKLRSVKSIVEIGLQNGIVFKGI